MAPMRASPDCTQAEAKTPATSSSNEVTRIQRGIGRGWASARSTRAGDTR